MPELSVNATTLFYECIGSGPPLVLIHGLGSHRQVWTPILAGAAAHRDVIAVDLPGHGESPRQPKGAGNAPSDLAVAVAELLDELGLPDAHVAGNSSGGWVALELGKLGRARTVTALAAALALYFLAWKADIASGDAVRAIAAAGLSTALLAYSRLEQR